MTFKGQSRSIRKLTDEEMKEMTDAESAEFIAVTRCRLSTEFAKKGDPRNWKSMAKRPDALPSAIDHYSAWLRGDWNDTRGVTPPKDERGDYLALSAAGICS